MSKIFNRAVKFGGETMKVGTPQVTVLDYDIDSKVLRATGATLPTDGDAGYAKGSVFIKTGGAAGDTLYVNVGSATSADFNVVATPNRVIDVTSSSVTITATTHAESVVTLNRAAGIEVTLPAASGSGNRYRFFVGTTITSNTTTIKVASASDIMSGLALVAQDSADTVVGFETASNSDTITLNGTTTGGIKGDFVELVDVASGVFYVSIKGSATGTEATPFSATVS